MRYEGEGKGYIYKCCNYSIVCRGSHCCIDRNEYIKVDESFLVPDALFTWPSEMTLMNDNQIYSFGYDAARYIKAGIMQ
jgi:hypothetical protein